MKKILFINSTLNIGGAERMLYEIIRRLDKAKFDIRVACLYKPGYFGERLISEGINLRHGLMKNKYDLTVVYRLVSVLKKELPDVLYIEASPLVLVWGFISGRIAGAPIMKTVIHSMKPGLKLRIKSYLVNTLILKRLDRIGVVSMAKLKSLIKTYKLDPCKIELIYNAIDIDRFNDVKAADCLRETLGIPKNVKVIGIVARLVKEKALDVFLESAKKVMDSIPDSKFLIVGEGRERSMLEKLAAHLGIKGKVIFLGERQDIPEIISLFDVAVLSSRAESFPLVLLEYMASSMPIVATSVGGNPEIIVDGETGMLVPPEDPDRLAKAIAGLLMDKKMSKDTGFKARQLLESRFSMQSLMNKMEDFLFSTGCNMNDERTHVLLVGPAIDVKGGVSSFARYFLNANGSDRFKVIYIATTVDGNKILKTFYFIKSLACFIYMLLFDKRIRIVHICSASRGSFYRKSAIMLIAKIFKKKTIFHIHGSSFDVFYNNGHPVRRFYMRRILDLADMPLVLSETWFAAISKMTKNRNVKTIHYYIDTSDFKLINKLKGDAPQFNIFTAGRLEQRKGTYDILKAVKLVLKEVPDAMFYLAGDGDIDKVAGICRKQGMEMNVHVLGWLDRPGLLDAFSKATIFLLPSYHEGLPIAIMEAMASGLPVISTKVGGIPEAIEDGINGFLINPGNVIDMSKKIVTLLKDKKLRDRMSMANIEKIDAVFSLDMTIRRFHEEYEYLLKTKTSGHDNKLTRFAHNLYPDNFSWYLRRLSLMSFPEIIHRLRVSILINVNRFLQNDIMLEKVLIKRKAQNKSFYFDKVRFRDIKQEFSKLFPGIEEKIVDTADRLCSHEFKIFNLDWHAGKTIDWRMDITTGKRWPLRYWIDIDFRNNTYYGEARFIWELNRQQHLVTLGKAYFLTRDERYAGEIVEELLSWVDQNPAYMGINWASPLETGLRLISWCWAYKFIEDSKHLTQKAKEKILRSVFQQARFIRNNLSLYSSANNHLIGESCALIVTGLTFNEFKDSMPWVKKGRDILLNEMHKQVYQDGVSKEQAFHYQGFVMQLFILAAELMTKNNIAFSESGLRIFLKMSEFIMNIMDVKGNIPNTGDSDNGMAIRLSGQEDFNVFKSLLCIAGILSGRGDFKERCGGFKEEHYWLLGQEGLKRYKNIRPVKQDLKSALYKDGGYAILRNGSGNGKEKVLVMDCGQVGYLSIAAHGHADLLSITLSAYGTQLLIDPGTYLYHTRGKWRHYFRAVKAHNTIDIDNDGQAHSKGLFMWGSRPYPDIERWESSDSKDYISASYSYGPISHKRSVCFDKEDGTWAIRDMVNVEKRRSVNQYFHLAPGSNVQRLSRNIIQVLNNGIFLYLIIDPVFRVEIKQGEENPILGWSSAMFGEKTASPTIINSIFIEESSVFNTLLYVSKETT